MRGKKTGGRKRGTPNKLSGLVRDMVYQALHDVGGVAYLTKQARENPAAFMTLLGKLMPSEVMLAVGVKTWEELITEATNQ